MILIGIRLQICSLNLEFTFQQISSLSLSLSPFFFFFLISVFSFLLGFILVNDERKQK